MKIKLEIETVDATYPTDQLEEVLEAIKENFIKDVKDLIKIEAQITKKKQ